MAIFKKGTFNTFKKIGGAMAHLAHPVAAALRNAEIQQLSAIFKPTFKEAVEGFTGDNFLWLGLNRFTVERTRKANCCC